MTPLPVLAAGDEAWAPPLPPVDALELAVVPPAPEGDPAPLPEVGSSFSVTLGMHAPASSNVGIAERRRAKVCMGRFLSGAKASTACGILPGMICINLVI
jgi:hypothetical protein